MDQNGSRKAYMGFDPTLTDFRLYLQNGANKFTINGGNVGIGNYNPISPLHVSGGNDAILTLQSTDDTWLYTNWMDMSGIRRTYMGLSNNLSQFRINLENGTNTFTINVGIGTYSPVSKLEIAGDGSSLLRLRPNSGSEDNSITFGAAHPSINRAKILSTGNVGDVSGDLRFIVNLASGGPGLTAMTMRSTGNIGIGTSNPFTPLHIYKSGGGLEIDPYNGPILEFIDRNDINASVDANFFARKQGSFKFYTGSYSQRMIIDGTNGNVGIGTASPDAKLTVKGDIHTQKVTVDLLGAIAPDFVFEEDYDLKTLEEIEKYIRTKKHLPEIPSAAEMEENGFELKEMNLKLLQKVEELTLHLIEQNKKIKNLEDEMAKLKN